MFKVSLALKNNKLQIAKCGVVNNATETNYPLNCCRKQLPQVCLVLALAIAGVAAQEVASNAEAAPEPYSYGYSTDTHSAQEQRDPSGRVTGSYMLVGDDGRERRVEYVADEAGFRAKVATNEVGTKSESPADVELIASEPTPAQLAYVQSPAQPQVQYGVAPVARQQVQQFSQVQRVAAPVGVTTVQQPAVGYRQVSSGSYYRQAAPQTGYGYYPGYGYGSGLALNNGYYGYGTTLNNRAYGTGYGSTGYGYNNLGYGVSGLVNVGNYNNHLPSQYYRSVSSSNVASGSPVGYTVGTGGYRYVNQPAGVTSSTVRTVGVPTTSSVGGSSNYIVLQKRAAEEKAKSS